MFKGLMDPEFWKAVNERASENGLLGPYVQSLNQFAGLMSGAVTPQEFGAIKSQQLHDQFNSPEGMMNFVPFGGVTAWHGSPHKFDKFSMNKIGTGEGAQSYGHGLYFAESPAVAKEYRKNLTDTKPFDAFDADKGYGVKDGGETRWFANERDARDFIRYDQGSLYKVDIADSAIPKMLDWDAPLSKQPKEAQPVLRDMWRKAGKSFGGIDPKADPTFSQIHHLYAQHRGGNSAVISEELRAAGIPGIRYKDGMSRGKDAGTHNYVLFDEDLVKILERQ